VSRSLIVGTAKDKSTGRRIPAANLETLVITKLRSFLADEGAILDAIRHEYAEGNAQARIIARGFKIAKEIESLTPDRIRVMLMTLISRVDIRPDCVEISVLSIAPDRAARVRLDRACDATRDARQ
jgi:site-specific DNA recombinase